MISLLNVSFAYDANQPEKKAVNEVSLSLEEGEFVGVIGHNGSGKSTLAKLFNGLLVPTEGDVLVCGLNTKQEENLVAIRRTVGMVFQNPDNQTVATIVEEDVAFGPENLGVPHEELRPLVERSLASVGMLELKDKKPHQLSGGQKQRVAIAGVLAMHPKCIVFDESTAMLDPSGRREVLSAMRRLNKEEGVTIVHITHYMEELTEADRIIAIDEGSLAFDLPPAQAFGDLELLRRLRLDAPEIVQIAEGLRKGGLEIPNGVLGCDDLVEAICRLT